MHDHDQGATKEWEPANGAERLGWTWVANALHAFSMALLVLAVMGVWRYQRGTALAALPLAGLVAAAGWLSFHLWPTLGLPAQVPGMEAAPLHARQLWSTLAVGSAAALASSRCSASASVCRWCTAPAGRCPGWLQPRGPRRTGATGARVCLGHNLGRIELLAQHGPGLRPGVSALATAGADGKFHRWQAGDGLKIEACWVFRY
jgi:hypothetical protein